MVNQRPKNIRSVLFSVLVTAVVVGGAMYVWQSSQTPPSAAESEMNYAVAIEQDASGESFVTVQDTYNDGAGFSLEFPSSWGLVNVTKRNLADSGSSNAAQRASYTFTSEFRADTHYLTVIISLASKKDSSLVTQGNRVYIGEDESYYYNYNPSTEYCEEEGKCEEGELEEINAEIQEIVDSFEFL